MKRLEGIIIMCVLIVHGGLSAQTIYEYSRDDATMLFFDKNTSQYIPHITRMYQNGKYLHNDLWGNAQSAIEPPMMMITDWEDDGNGGVSAIPNNSIAIGMAPLNFSYFISPSTERYHHLFCHEYTHTVMTDKTARRDRLWRHFTGGKFTVDSSHPWSALWSYLGAPRWYAPRWYHEGIACFMETWMGGGVGRALGGYDEMYFRSLINEEKPLYSVVGLETEGTVKDFQLGTNSYLYGTRFVNYLALRHGIDSLVRFYNRTEDSKMLFNHQFSKVYGQSLRKEWQQWIDYEHEHQTKQLEKVRQYPITHVDTLTDQCLGSVSPMVIDEHRQKLYYACNYPGDFAHLEEYDIPTGKRTKLHKVDGPMLYQTSFVALDTLRQRLIYTTQNSQMRGLRVLDIKSRRVIKKLNYQRVSDIVYDNQRDCLYGIMSNGGMCFLVRYDKDLKESEVLYPFNFGLSVFDLAVSHSGRYVTATISEKDGQQTLIRFDLDALGKVQMSYEKLYTLDDSNLGQFRFMKGDSIMVGSSYYTGVSNLWQLNLKTKKLDLLTNTDIGLFAPVEDPPRDQDPPSPPLGGMSATTTPTDKKANATNAEMPDKTTSAGMPTDKKANSNIPPNGGLGGSWSPSLFALQFSRDGMRPVRLQRQILHDANSISLLGQEAYEAHPKEFESIGEHKTPVPKIAYNEVFDSIKIYHPFQRLRFNGAFPEVSAFTDRRAWNNMSPVLGYRFMFSDPMGLHTLRLSVGIDPWSNNAWKNRFHADVEWQYWNWTVTAAWNHTSFYDLFGPVRSSRKGWRTTVAYERSNSMLSPYSSKWGFLVGAYGDMDALPLYQNIEVEDGISSFQTANVYWKASKTRTSLGGIIAEQGWSFSADASTYLADGRFFPSLDLAGALGWLLPWRNTSFWLLGYAGQSFGDQTSSFGGNYFGGFRNNYVDSKSIMRYRESSAMPGAEIDEISAHNYGKLTAELNLRPYHFNNVGAMNLYPTVAFMNVFSSILVTDPYKLKLYHDGEGIASSHTYWNIGAQLNIEAVMFKYLKTTWSVGYARIFMPDHTNKGQWMFSLKLL